MKISESAFASKFKLRMVLVAPRNAGVLVELALAFAALKVRSVELPKVTFADQLELVPQFPPPSPVQVCDRAGRVNKANVARAKKNLWESCREKKD
jgi:hypothetical protein